MTVTSEAPRRIAHGADESAIPRATQSGVEHGEQALIDEARRRQRRRYRRLGFTAVVVAIAGVLIVTASVVYTSGRRAGRSTTSVRTPVLGVRTPIVLDFFLTPGTGFGTTNVTVDLNTGIASQAPDPVAAAIPRDGYIFVSSQDYWVSRSYDLRHTIHTWTDEYGAYFAPASNPADIWATSGSGQAVELNVNEQPVRAPVALPSGFIVEGQVGPNLVLTAAYPAPALVLWDPVTQRVLAVLSAPDTVNRIDQIATGNGLLAWTVGNVVHFVHPDGTTASVVTGPPGMWATSVAFAPKGPLVAMVWQPALGTLLGGRSGYVALVNAPRGSSSTVPGSSGAASPVEWSPDGTRVFFPVQTRWTVPPVMASYLLGTSAARHLDIAGLGLPTHFPVDGALVVWSRDK